jgi:hypothetical protein
VLEARDLLGHEDVSTTNIYLEATAATLEQAILRKGAADRARTAAGGPVTPKTIEPTDDDATMPVVMH